MQSIKRQLKFKINGYAVSWEDNDHRNKMKKKKKKVSKEEKSFLSTGQHSKDRVLLNDLQNIPKNKS